MRRSASVVLIAAVLVVAAPGGLLRPAAARAGLGSFVCGALGKVGEGWWGTACNGALSVGQKVIGGGKKAAGAIGKVAGNPLVQRGAGIAALVAWVLGGAKWTMDHMASVISHTTSPTLTASWFTRVYLRIEGLALFFTLLFVCAAAAEAVLRSDTAVLARAVFGYLPVAALLTALAAPLTMLLLAATDELSAGLAQVAGEGATHFLSGASAWAAAGLTAADPFFAVIAGGLVVAAGGALWVEMLIREVAVYVVVAMLPVVFAAMVWPARRVWAIRAIELLVALILAKVAIVAVLALGGAALAHAGAGGLSRLLGGLALVILGAFCPWLLLRLIPLAEVASASVGHIRGHVHASAQVRTPEAALASQAAHHAGGSRGARAGGAADGLVVGELLEQMHRQGQAAENASHPVVAGSNGGPRSSVEPATSGRPGEDQTNARAVQREPAIEEADQRVPRGEPIAEAPDLRADPSAEREPAPALPSPPADPQDAGLPLDEQDRS